MYLNKKRKGFTLLEIMIAIAIMVILAAVAISMYSNYVSKAHLINDLMIPSDKLVLFDYYNNNGSFGDASTDFDNITVENSLARPVGVVVQKNVSWVSPTEVEVIYDIKD